METITGGDQGNAGATIVTWKFGGPTGKTISSHLVGQTIGALSGSETSISFLNVGGEFSGVATANASTYGTGTWDIQLLRTDNSILTTTGTITSSGAGTVTFNISPNTVGGATGTLSAGKFKPTISSWDYPDPATGLEPSLFNRNHPNYYWPQIKDKNGNLDIANKQSLFPVHYHDTDLFVASDIASGLVGITQWGCVGVFEDHFVRYNYTNNSWFELPCPPLNNPGGATVDWPDNAEAGTWNGQLNASFTTWMNLNASAPSVIDSINTLSQLYVDVGFHYTDVTAISPSAIPAGTVLANIGVGSATRAPGGNAATAAKWRIPQYWLDTTGTLQDKSFSTTTGSSSTAGVVFPLSNAMTKLVGDHVQGATDLTVASATGMVPGQKLMIWLDHGITERRGGKGFITTIDRVIDATRISISTGLAFAGTRGDYVCALTPGGAKPSYWLNVVDWFNSLNPSIQ